MSIETPARPDTDSRFPALEGIFKRDKKEILEACIAIHSGVSSWPMGGLLARFPQSPGYAESVKQSIARMRRAVEVFRGLRALYGGGSLAASDDPFLCGDLAVELRRAIKIAEIDPEPGGICGDFQLLTEEVEIKVDGLIFWLNREVELSLHEPAAIGVTCSLQSFDASCGIAVYSVAIAD